MGVKWYGVGYPKHYVYYRDRGRTCPSEYESESPSEGFGLSTLDILVPFFDYYHSTIGFLSKAVRYTFGVAVDL